jgi:hypothetical protein
VAPKEPKISKQAAAVKTRYTTLTIPEIMEIIRETGSAIGQSVIMAAYKITLLTIYGIKKQKENLPVRT